LLNQRGILTKAEVVYLAEHISRGVHYFVTYVLPDIYIPNNSVEIQVTQEIGKEKYSRLRKGVNVTVRYLVYRPQIARLAEYDEDTTRRSRATLVALFFFVIFPPLIPIFILMLLVDRLRTLPNT
jgi:hypothetical protein